MLHDTGGGKARGRIHVGLRNTHSAGMAWPTPSFPVDGHHGHHYATAQCDPPRRLLGCATRATRRYDFATCLDVAYYRLVIWSAQRHHHTCAPSVGYADPTMYKALERMHFCTNV